MHRQSSSSERASKRPKLRRRYSASSVNHPSDTDRSTRRKGKIAVRESMPTNNGSERMAHLQPSVPIESGRLPSPGQYDEQSHPSFLAESPSMIDAVFDDSDSDMKEEDLDVSIFNDSGGGSVVRESDTATHLWHDSVSAGTTTSASFAIQQADASSSTSATAEDQAQTFLTVEQHSDVIPDWAASMSELDWVGMGWPGMEDALGDETPNVLDVSTEAQSDANVNIGLDSCSAGPVGEGCDVGDVGSGVGQGVETLRPSDNGMVDHDADAAVDGDEELDYFDDEVDAALDGWLEEPTTGDDRASTEQPDPARDHLNESVTFTANALLDISNVPLPAPSPSISLEVPVRTTADGVLPSDNLCEYNGATCSCTAAHHSMDPSLPTSSELQIDRNCKIMDVLKLSFHRFHRYLICRQCCAFIPLANLMQHLDTKHPDLFRGGKAGRRTAGKDFPGVMKHFSVSLCIERTQELTLFNQASFDGPVHGLEDAELSYQCTTCGRFYQTIRSLQSHHRKADLGEISCVRTDFVHLCDGCGVLHQTTDSLAKHLQESCRRSRAIDSIPTVWTQKPFAASKNARRVEVRGRLSTIAATSTLSSADPIQRYAVPEGPNSPCPPWLDKIGWVKWRDAQVERGITTSQLADFAAPTPVPPRHKGRKPSYGPLSEKEVFDWAANRIRIRLEKMIKDANTWLNTCNVELRADITAKYDTLHASLP